MTYETRGLIQATVVVFLLTGTFWCIYSLINGSIPVSKISLLSEGVGNIEISRGWDLLAFPAMTFMFLSTLMVGSKCNICFRETASFEYTALSFLCGLLFGCFSEMGYQYPYNLGALITYSVTLFLILSVALVGCLRSRLAALSIGLFLSIGTGITLCITRGGLLGLAFTLSAWLLIALAEGSWRLYTILQTEEQESIKMSKVA